MVRAEKQPPFRNSWRKNIQRCLRRFCCSCFPGEEMDSLQENGINGDDQQDKQGSGEKEATQITVKDLGTVNCGFSLLEEDHLTLWNSIGHPATSMTVSPRPLRKKQLQPLPSLQILHQANVDITTATGENDKDEREEMIEFEYCTDNAGASGSLLEQPIINLIPPTPAAVADKARFFNGNLEGSVEPGPESSKTPGGTTHKVPVKVSKEESKLVETQASGEAEPGETQNVPFAEERGTLTNKEEDKEKAKSGLLHSTCHVVSLHQHLLKNLSDGDLRFADVPRADLCLFPRTADMASSQHQQKLITRSLSEGEALTSSAASFPLNWTPSHREERDAQQKRCLTLASYMPPSEDQNGNLSEKDMGRQQAKSLGKLNIDEVCHWFTGIGLHKCLPFIREAKLCGTDIAAVSLELLHTLHISTAEDRERLLSAIYTELHPPTQLTQKLDALLESSNPCNVETFTAALASLNKSISSPHVSCLSMRQRSLKLRNKSRNYTVPRNSHLIEITINMSEQIVHLRTPKETTVGKVMDSCIKMLGVTEDKSLFIMTETQGSSEKLPSDQLIGSLVKSDNKQLELHLCKIEKPVSTVSHTDPEAKCSGQKSSNAAKEERIRELNQQVDSLQNTIYQIQELHHDLVAFCSELKNADSDVTTDRLDSDQLRQKLELVKGCLSDKKQKMQTLRDHVNSAVTHEKKQTLNSIRQLDVHLLEKMKLNCQVFKEEISVVHLNRQVAHLQNALQETDVKEKVQRKNSTIGCLSQLVSLESPAMLLAVQESHDPCGHYGFTCGCTEGRGLVVMEVVNSRLCVGDRLVEVNGVPVVSATLKELEDILLQGPSAQIVVLRQPPPSLTSQQNPLLLGSDRGVVSIETTPQRKAIVI